MAIQAPKEQWTDRSVSGNKQNGYTGKRVWLVHTTTMTDSPTAVGNACIPTAPFDGIPYDTHDVAVVGPNTLGGLLYKVTANYQTPDNPNNTPGQSDADPLLRAAITSYQVAEGGEEWFYDHTGDNLGAPDPTKNQPFVNTAGLPFDNLPQRQKCTRAIVVKKNVAAFNNAVAATFDDKVNDAVFTWRGINYQPGELLCVGPAAEEQQEGATTYFSVTTILKVNLKGWNNEKVGSYGRSGRIQGMDGLQPFPEDQKRGLFSDVPKKLDNDGFYLSAAQQSNPAVKPAQITFQPYLKTAFSGLSAFTG